jgi:hypothetical protein
MRKEFILVNVLRHEIAKDRKGQPIIKLGKKPYDTPRGFSHADGYQWESIEEIVIDRNHTGKPRYAMMDSQKAICTKFIAPKEKK